jgi:hypothetical protein
MKILGKYDRKKQSKQELKCGGRNGEHDGDIQGIQESIVGQYLDVVFETDKITVSLEEVIL